MKKIYEISGLSCGGCVSSVKNALLRLPDDSDGNPPLGSRDWDCTNIHSWIDYRRCIAAIYYATIKEK